MVCAKKARAGASAGPQYYFARSSLWLPGKKGTNCWWFLPFLLAPLERKDDRRFIGGRLSGNPTTSTEFQADHAQLSVIPMLTREKNLEKQFRNGPPASDPRQVASKRSALSPVLTFGARLASYAASPCEREWRGTARRSRSSAARS